MLQNLLKHPIYAGAYAYGRRQIDPRRKRPGRPATGRVVAGSEDWLVFLKDRFPAYLSWGQYERNQARLRANRARADEVGVARNGPALLSGVAVCARCGCRMTVQYTGEGKRHTYVCTRRLTDYGEEACQQLAGACLDAFVRQQVLAALEPAALDLSLAAAQRLETERADLDRLWQQRLERATYEVERAGRQYRLVDPENRLVARQLEREWEEKLAARQRLEEEYQRFVHQQPRLLTAQEREAIRRLAADIPTLWDDATTTHAERKEVLRQVVERVEVGAHGESEKVTVSIDWVGGTRTTGELVRPVARLEQLTYYPALCQRLRELADLGLASAEIAARLNAEGYRPPKRRHTYSAPGVQELLHRLGIQPPPTPHATPSDPVLGAHEWLLAPLAQTIGMPPVTLFNWVKRDWVRARQEETPPRRWILWADAAEVARLRERHQRPNGYYTRRLWMDGETTQRPLE
jgi:hypothetical protein